MILTLVNANIEFEHLNHKLSEFIYQLENLGNELHYIHLQHVSLDDCKSLHQLLALSDLVIYISPLDSKSSQIKLNKFLDNYRGDHPKIFLVLDSNELLSVQRVTDYIEMFEKFIDKHHSKIIDVQYFKDALDHILTAKKEG